MNPRTIIIGIAAGILAIIGGFMLIQNVSNGENTICGENGFANEYDAEKGVCKSTGNYAKNLTMVVGNTANTPAPSIEKDGEIYNYLKNSIASGAKIKMISAASDLSVMPISYEITNTTNDASGFVEAVDTAMNSIIEQLRTPATSDGATYYEAIMKAGRDASTSARSSAGDQSNNVDNATVLVLGSGLSDGGIMNFSKDELLYRSATEVIDAMGKANQLATSLNGLTIRWLGIGQSKEPQKALPSKELENLKDIYYEVLMAKGADRVFFYDNASSNDALNGKYKVVPTPIRGTIIWEFSNKELEFITNTDRLKNESEAKKVLDDVIQWANTNSNSKITITGYMAAGQCSSNVDTSLAFKRAEAIKKILSTEVDSSRIETVNGGVPEGNECVNGVWQNELAESKRKVTIEFK